MVGFFDQRIHPASPTRAKLSIHLVAKTSARHDVNKVAEVMEAGGAVDGCEASDSRAKLPTKIGNVKSWKDSLPLTMAAMPVRGVSEFENLGIGCKSSLQDQSDA